MKFEAEAARDEILLAEEGVNVIVAVGARTRAPVIFLSKIETKKLAAKKRRLKRLFRSQLRI